MLVFDRGYTDYDWLQRLTEEGVHFVAQLKDKAPIAWWRAAAHSNV